MFNYLHLFSEEGGNCSADPKKLAEGRAKLLADPAKLAKFRAQLLAQGVSQKEIDERLPPPKGD